MPRPVTLFTGQWADIPSEELFPKVKAMGFDGVELACWGDHFDVQAALNDPTYIPARWELLKKHDWDGVVSIEAEARPGIAERSLEWLRKEIAR